VNGSVTNLLNAAKLHGVVRLAARVRAYRSPYEGDMHI